MIKLNNISKIYEVNNNEIIAVNNVTLKIKKGQVVVLKGPSGSGKSTILSMIASITKPTFGDIVVNDEKISKLSDSFASFFRSSNIGFVFQQYNLIHNLSAYDNVLLPLVPLNLPQKLVEEKVLNSMKLLNISHKKDIVVKSLSGGEQQRIAIARAMVNNPDIIIADEPSANLDEKLSLQFIDTLQSLKDLGKTIVISSHDPLIFNHEIVDEIINIKNGNVV